MKCQGEFPLQYKPVSLTGELCGKCTVKNQQPKEKTGLKGFEPLTCGLRVRRYAELSYRPTLLGLIMWSMMPNKGFGMLRVIRPEAGEEHEVFFDLIQGH
jgi:hypothetical protein